MINKHLFPLVWVSQPRLIGNIQNSGYISAKLQTQRCTYTTDCSFHLKWTLVAGKHQQLDFLFFYTNALVKSTKLMDSRFRYSTHCWMMFRKVKIWSQHENPLVLLWVVTEVCILPTRADYQLIKTNFSVDPCTNTMLRPVSTFTIVHDL